MKDNNIKINGQNVFDQSINSDTKHMQTFEKLPLVEEITIQLHACWINHISEKYKMIVIDLSEQQKQDNGPRTCWEYKKAQGTVKVL